MKGKKIDKIQSIIIDISVVFCITLFFNRLLHYFFIQTTILFPLILVIYYFVCYCGKRHQSIGNYLTGIMLVAKNDEKLSISAVLKREIAAKLAIGLIVPVVILCFFYDSVYSIAIWVLLVNLFVVSLYYLLKKEVWWDTLAKTQSVKIQRKSKKKWMLYGALLLFWGLTYGLLLGWNNYNNPSTNKIAGFKYPIKFVAYPNNSKVEKYTEYLKKVSQDPKEYILNLFEKYDIVILAEHYHPENTQWDIIYDLISDQRFIENVGNLFTEYGDVHEQAKADAFFLTPYPDDSTLSKATSELINYHSSNFYHFLKKMHKLNQTLPDSLKIKEHFTDIIDYPTDSMINKIRTNIAFRDSMMAQVVIEWYGKTGKKCLVVTNSRHAFAFNHRAKSQHYKAWAKTFYYNEGQYIYDAFPLQTANVLIDRLASYKVALSRHYNVFFTCVPVQQGKWKTAFKNNAYKAVGFDLADSPFGDDSFDVYSALYRCKDAVKYKDVFKGFIFYAPEEQYSYDDRYLIIYMLVNLYHHFDIIMYVLLLIPAFIVSTKKVFTKG
jgi:uncharacterized RDD family membrane protein YckC